MRLLKLFVALTIASLAHGSNGGEFHWSGKVAAGHVIEIKGVNGGVTAEPSTGKEVEVTAHKTSRHSDPSDVDIRVVEHGDGVTICAVYPDAGNECLAGSGGRMNANHNDVQVEFHVRVPAGVRFTARTVNGGVDAESLDGDVEAYTVNGKIRVGTEGAAQARTVNGSIVASFGNTAWTGTHEFSTVNGGIRLNLPSRVDADVNASTVNGHIDTDFPLTVHGSFGGRNVRGTIGNGGHDLKLNTVNGSIELRQAARTL